MISGIPTAFVLIDLTYSVSYDPDALYSYTSTVTSMLPDGEYTTYIVDWEPHAAPTVPYRNSSHTASCDL